MIAWIAGTRSVQASFPKAGFAVHLIATVFFWPSAHRGIGFATTFFGAAPVDDMAALASNPAPISSAHVSAIPVRTFEDVIVNSLSAGRASCIWTPA
jgi:hypothetical protein